MTIAPAGATGVDPDLANDAACTLVELSTVPDDAELLRRAAEQLPPLTTQVRRATGTSDSVDDAGWLDAWRPCGIVIERNR